MPNTNPQAIHVINNKIRPLADRLGQLYNLCKALQGEAVAEGWSAMFAGGATNTIMDGSDVDGRSVITDADVSAFITDITTFINDMEATSNARRNRALKIAVRPEMY
jgi:UDP-N-acetylglucosamine enolpyruvyl transferase